MKDTVLRARAALRRDAVEVAKRLLRPLWRRVRARIVTAVLEETQPRQRYGEHQIELLHALIRELRETLSVRMSGHIDAATGLLLGELAKVEARFAALDTRFAELELSAARRVGAAEDRLNRRLDEVWAKLRELDALDRVETLADRFKAAPYMDHDVFGPGANGVVPAREPGGFDYLGFENVFRGSEALVRDRQRVYLQFFQPGQRVLDVGCGRGEFLSVLAGADVAAVGVDTNAAMVEHCRAAGFGSVEQTDVNAFLERSEERFDGIFSAQVIEHLQFEDLNRFFALAARRLRPGGIFIAETVNPHSIEAMKTFYVDLTHVKPLFPETMLFLARNAGFANAKIFYPNGRGFGRPDDWTQHEYALVAWKGDDE